jgi:hypothetical protein
MEDDLNCAVVLRGSGCHEFAGKLSALATAPTLCPSTDLGQGRRCNKCFHQKLKMPAGAGASKIRPPRSK